MLAATPDPPYIAVIFTAVFGPDATGYDDAVTEMRALAEQQPGFLGMDAASADDGGIEITVSYWATPDDAAAWKDVAEHREAQRAGRERWYDSYQVRIAHVDRAYGGGT